MIEYIFCIFELLIKFFAVTANKDLAIWLIQADLKHNQLISGHESMDFETNSYFLNLDKPVGS